MLAREVLRLRGVIPDRQTAWTVMPDLYFYRDPEEIEAPAQAEEETAEEPAAEVPAVATGEDWSVAPDAGAGAADWANDDWAAEAAPATASA